MNRKSIIKPVQSMINLLYNDNNKSFIVPKNAVDYVVVDGLKYGFNHEISSLVHFKHPYHWFDNIKKDDICLDIGACIGAFCIPASTKAKYVYAIEPLWWKELKENKEMNGIANITIYQIGINSHNGEQVTMQYGEHKETVKTLTMQKLIESLPVVNIIKCDCEGAEWGFEPKCFVNAREIHMEFHIRKMYQVQDTYKYEQWLMWFKEHNYQYEVLVDNRDLGIFCPFSKNTGVRFQRV